VREPRACEPRHLRKLHAPHGVQHRLLDGARPEAVGECAHALRDLVEEQVFLRREVVEDGLLGDPCLGRHLRYRHMVEAARHEQAHGDAGDLLPRRELLGLAQTHGHSVTRSLQLR
jgi:hypothetical protein